MTTFSMSGDNRGRTLAIFYQDGTGDSVTIPDSHEKFQEILDLWTSGEADDESIRGLVNSMHAVGQKLSRLSERVTVTSYGVFFDGDPLRGELSDLILTLVEENKEERFQPLVKFLEKVRTNPSGVSVDALYKWITNGDLVITPDGDIVAYKGVKIGSNDESLSISSGEAIVDGRVVHGCIPNDKGSVVEMPRSKVDANNRVGCSTGLHAGTYSYALGFAQGRVILVQINPRDVVSVPDDWTFQKLRVSRYTVLSHINQRLNVSVYSDQDEDADDPDEDDYCECCGEEDCYGEECLLDDDDDDRCDCDDCIEERRNS